jgi:hypothetical protein
VRNKRELNARLKGATLGDADHDVDNAKAWLKKSKKKERDLAAKRLKEIESMDDAAQGEYNESAWTSTLRRLYTNALVRYRRFGGSQSQP